MSVTEWVLALTAAFLIVFDIYIIIEKGKQESISSYVIRWVNSNRILFLLTLALGVIFGHLFWQMDPEDIYPNLKCTTVEEKK